MILTLIDVVLPVFIVIGAGFAAVKFKLFPDAGVEGLMSFTQNFAIPCLLFRATMSLDLETYYDPGLLISFYAGAAISFLLGVVGARVIFKRRPGEAVAIGFAALFSNSVLLGLPLTERAFGADALGPNYMIVSVHALFCYGLGIICMEFARADGVGPFETLRVATAAVFKNALMIGILLGFAANLTGFQPPGSILAAVDMMVAAALPAALFGLGGVLTRYRIVDKFGQVAMIAILSLGVHPLITFGLGTQAFDLPQNMLRSAVLTSAMAPGVNAYVFARMYGRAVNVASSAVLITTTMSILTATFWLSLLN